MAEFHPSNLDKGLALTALFSLETIGVFALSWDQYGKNQIADARELLADAQDTLVCVEGLPDSAEESIPNDVTCIEDVRASHGPTTTEVLGRLVFDASRGELVEDIHTVTPLGNPEDIRSTFTQRVADQRVYLGHVEVGRFSHSVDTVEKVDLATAGGLLTVWTIAKGTKAYMNRHSKPKAPHEPRRQKQQKAPTSPKRSLFFRVTDGLGITDRPHSEPVSTTQSSEHPHEDKELVSSSAVQE